MPEHEERIIMRWQYLPDFGEVHDEKCNIVAKLAPDLNWHDLPDEDRERWDRIGEAIAELGDDEALA